MGEIQWVDYRLIKTALDNSMADIADWKNREASRLDGGTESKTYSE